MTKELPFANETIGTSARKSLPTIKYGEPCHPGQSYRMDCNRCFCTSAAKLLCTQIACADWFDKKPYKIHKKLLLAVRQGKTNKTLRNKKVTATEGKGKKTNNTNLSSEEVNANKMLVARDGKSNKTIEDKKLAARENNSNKTLKHKKLTVREGNTNEAHEHKKLAESKSKTNKTQLRKKTKLRQVISKRKPKETASTKNRNYYVHKPPIPDLPAEKCRPGRVYKSGCKRCLCDDSSNAQCSLKDDACPDKKGVTKYVKTPEDLRPPFTREELKKLKTLSSASDRCEPGFRYKVSCNLCVCLEWGNLLCSKELCLSYEDINRVEAAENSGRKCTEDPSPTSKGCIECKCVDKRLSCVDIPDCFADTRLKLSGGGKNNIKMKLDPSKEKCIPQGIYRDNCNRCYCQEDGTLRCTQKTCLVYSQAEKLRKQLKQLKN